MSLPPGFTGVTTTEQWRAKHTGPQHNIVEVIDKVAHVTRFWLRCKVCKASHLMGMKHEGDEAT